MLNVAALRLPPHAGRVRAGPQTPRAVVRGNATLRCCCCALVWLIAACSADSEYDAAIHANTVVAYDDYLRLHPDGAHAKDARARLASLVEDREWQRARAGESAESYQRYLNSYPNGVHAHDAQVAIQDAKLAQAPGTEAPTAGAARRATAAPPAVLTVPAAATGVSGAAIKGAIERAAPPPAPIAAPAPASPTPPTAAATSPRVAAARAPAAPAPPREDIASGYHVQLGAFSSGSAAASAAWKRLVNKHPELALRTPVIAAARSADGKQIHRLQISVASREAAVSLCTSLTAAHDACVVVPPPAPPAR